MKTLRDEIHSNWLFGFGGYLKYRGMESIPDGFPDKLTRLIKATLDGVMCHVRVSGDLAEPFGSRRGLRQGDGLSCALFNIVLEGIIRRAGIDTSGTIMNKSYTEKKRRNPIPKI